MLECVMFDLGDTLIKQKHSLNHIITKIQIPMIKRACGKSIPLEEFERIADKTDEIIKEEHSHMDHLKKVGLWPKIFFEELGVKISDEFGREWDEKFDEYYLKNAELMPGARQILGHLKERKVKLILVTNGTVRNTNYKLKKFKLKKYFDLIVISENIGDRKSSLKPFKFALERMGGNPSQYLMVGDRVDEDGYAKELGMKFCWFVYDKDYESNVDEGMYDYLIHDLSELKNIVKGLT